jgi:hypothetical protein
MATHLIIQELGPIPPEHGGGFGYLLACQGKVRLANMGVPAGTAVGAGPGDGPCPTCAAYGKRLAQQQAGKPPGAQVTSGQAHGGQARGAFGGFDTTTSAENDQFIGGLEDDVNVGVENDPYGETTTLGGGV